MRKEQVLAAFKEFKEYEVYLASLRTALKTDEEARKPIGDCIVSS